MTLLWVFSDLHLTHKGGELNAPAEDFDVIVVAGDHNGLLRDSIHTLINWRDKVAPGKPIIYVPGNHDYYGGTFDFINDNAVCVAAAEHNIHVLNPGHVTIGDTKFVGATLWTDFNLYNDPMTAMRRAQYSMNDYNYIKYEGRNLIPSDTLKFHVYDKDYIRRHLSSCEDKTVVITHHLPLRECSHPKYGIDPLNASFASDLTKLFGCLNKPVAWIAGHTHTSFDFMYGNTRMVVNPRGYPIYRDYENKDFNPKLIIEV